MYRKVLFSLTLLSTCVFMVRAQNNLFSGAFANATNTVGFRLKAVGNEYHGLVQTNNGSFATKSSVNGNFMTGKIYTAQGPVDFSAKMQGFALIITYMGYTDSFYKVSAQHELDNIDLTQYMYTPTTQAQYPANGNQDYDHSYTSHSSGYATEKRQSYPSNGANSNSPYPALNDKEMFSLVAGTQLVYYTRTSILNSSTASSLTYVNYCPDGRFWMTYDGSFSVEGYYGDNAQGASNGQNSGRWQLVSYQGGPAVYLSFNNGNSSVHPVNKQLIYQGRWRVGNTQYAVQRNKVSCR